MISTQASKSQILRLSGMDFYPSNEVAAVRELVTALCTAKNELGAIAVIDSFVTDSTVCPKPADIYRAISRSAVAEEWVAAGTETRCEACEGTGWLHTTRIDHGALYGALGRKNDYVAKCKVCGGGGKK